MLVWLALARGLRWSGGPLLGLAVVLTIGIGAALGSLEAAARTDNAYPSYLRRAEVGELVVNPNLITERAEDVIASTPGVRRYVSDSVLAATPDRGEPRTEAELDSDLTQVRVSGNGRYVRQDRPVIQEGRMIGQGAEAVVNLEMAKALSIDVGDTLPLAFWSGFSRTPFAHTVSMEEGNDDLPPGRPGESRLLEPVGRAEARVVGIGVFPDEVLLDGLYPRHRVVVTPDVAARFDCRYRHPASDDPRPLEQITRSIVPEDCSTAYQYFSLRVDGGDRGVGAVTRSLAERFTAENDRLPAELTAGGIGFDVIPAVTAEERQRVQRSLAPAVTALQLFGVGAAASTIVVVVLAAVRIARRQEEAAGIWRDLGATRATRTAGIFLPLAAATAVGLGGSLVVGWLTSALGPVASARLIEPAGRFGLSLSVVLSLLGGSAVVLAVGLILVAGTASSCQRHAPPRGGSRRPSVVAAHSPPLILGVRSAANGGAARALLIGAVAAVSAVLAVVVFSTSLAALVSRPERFGWPYDIAATIDLGYGGTTDPEAIAATLDRPEVARWGLASVWSSLTINGETMPSVAGRTGFDAMRLPVVEGKLPVASDEIALGALTAERLALHVGAEVVVKTLYGDRPATISGLVVLPPVGPFQGDRASLGTGALLPRPFFDELLRGAAEEAGDGAGHLPEEPGGFVAIDLRPGADPETFLRVISDELATWDTSATPPLVYPEPVRPATVANLAAMRGVPVALAFLLALTMGIALVLGTAVATRGRRRELALLRALGCVGRQLRATVRWQALSVVAVGLAVGAPVGLAAGRIAYRAFASGLGVQPDAVVSFPWVSIVMAVTVAIGLLAAAGPERRAARVPAGEIFRQE
ncbi:MAG: FtsX-like permease family protein [Actinobacteria bacterium]|nr:FtsX-like permease family protein [Actinomycetota bacterium]